jgi:MFS family permease
VGHEDDEDGEDDEEEGFGQDAFETAREATLAFRKGRSSPYHMALVSLLFSLAQGMPLASQFKVYAYMMCQLYKARYAGSEMVRQSLVQAKITAIGTSSTLPPAPELPPERICENIWVDNATSTYAAAMAMVGALLSLILLNRCSRLSDYFGRKPLLLVTHVLLALSTTVFPLSIYLPSYVGVAVLYVAVMILEASAGAPLRIAIQNYVMDTTSEQQRAGALSFTDGFGQLGAFPSSTLGGWLAVVTQNFFAPFYASIAVYFLSTAYVLLFVPESKKNRHHTLIDGFERVGSSNNATKGRQGSYRSQQVAQENDDTTDDDDADTDAGAARTESYFSSVYEPHESEPYWRRLLHRFNFLAPLAVFIPDCRTATATRQSPGRKWRLTILALIVILEESYQVFMIPVILLYNTSVFHYDVVQNGYLVSLLQGVRAVYLTIFFPWAVSKARAWSKRRRESKKSNSIPNEPDERTALREGHLERDDEDNTQEEEQREERGRLDVMIMLGSYLISGASFILMAMTRTWSEHKNRSALPSWAQVAIAIVGLQIGAGATSLRTALLVNAVSEQADEQELLAHQEAVEQRRADTQRYGGSASSPRIARHYSALSTSAQSNNDGASSFHVHHERHQSKALAANQILCTAVYAIVPLVTSRIFGAGISMHKAELVWLFKSAMAFLSALTSLALLFSYQRR